MGRTVGALARNFNLAKTQVDRHETHRAPIDDSGDLVATGGYRYVAGPFLESNIAANTADIPTYTDEAGAIGRHVLAWDYGSILGYHGFLNGDAAGSALTISLVHITGRGATSTTIHTSSIAVGDRYFRESFSKDRFILKPFDQILINLTTDAGWTATTVDFRGYIRWEI